MPKKRLLTDWGLCNKDGMAFNKEIQRRLGSLVKKAIKKYDTNDVQIMLTYWAVVQTGMDNAIAMPASAIKAKR